MTNPEQYGRLLDDTAAATTQAVLDVFNLEHLRPEEVRDAHAAVLEVVRAGLTAYLEFRRREFRRLYRSDAAGN